jgi:hypothetical protein
VNLHNIRPADAHLSCCGDTAFEVCDVVDLSNLATVQLRYIVKPLGYIEREIHWRLKACTDNARQTLASVNSRVDLHVLEVVCKVRG